MSGSALWKRYVDLYNRYQAIRARKPQNKPDCDAAYNAAFRAWFAYRDDQVKRGLPVRKKP